MKKIFSLIVACAAVAMFAQDAKPEAKADLKASDVADAEVSTTDGTHAIKGGEVSFPGVSNAGRLVDVIANYPEKKAALESLRDTKKTQLAKQKNDAAKAEAEKASGVE